MKRTTLVFFVIALALTAAVGNSNDPLYGNIHLTLWRLEKGPTEAAERINTPIPRVYNESLLFSTFSIKLIDGKTHLRSLDKEDFHIHLKAEASRNLTITVTEKRKKRFDLLLQDNAGTLCCSSFILLWFDLWAN